MTQSDHDTAKTEKPEPLVKTTRALVFATAALAFASFGTDTILYLQLREMHDQLGEIRKSSAQVDQSLISFDRMASIAEQQNRAYLGLDWNDVIFKIGEVPSVRMGIKNSGRTPALNVKVWASALIRPEPLLPFFDQKYATYHTEVGTILPDRQSQPSIWANSSLSKKESADIFDPSQNLYLFVFGQITYSDALGRDHHINFCSTAAGREFEAFLAGKKNTFQWNDPTTCNSAD